MAEVSARSERRMRRIRHKGRGSQVLIYLGKQLRFFINESDWKVLPMAGVIAFLVSMVIRKRLFINMEGSLIGGFALTCVAIWNGCFNSIQAVCRERPIIKREHRSGMHITSYVAAHMIYQFFLCLLQTGLTMYVMIVAGVPFPDEGFITPFMVVDVGISMLLIAYAADMMSLFISSIAHTTTGAMTIMPFVLIFQLVFSGGIIPLPAWSQPLSNFTISNYGIKAIAAQTGYNELPMVTAWNTLSGMRSTEVGGSITLGQILDLLDSKAVEKRRDMELVKPFTVGEVADILSSADETLHLRDTAITHPVRVGAVVDFLRTSAPLASYRAVELLPADEDSAAVTVGSFLDEMAQSQELEPVMAQEMGVTITLGQVLDTLHAQDLVALTQDQQLNERITLGDAVDFLKNNEALQAQRDREFSFRTTIGELFDLFGEENIQQIVQTKTAQAAFKPEYACTEDNIFGNWSMLGLFIAAFALLSVLALELIDKDKR